VGVGEGWALAQPITSIIEIRIGTSALRLIIIVKYKACFGFAKPRLWGM
jgi:hypothetical protein